VGVPHFELSLKLSPLYYHNKNAIIIYNMEIHIIRDIYNHNKGQSLFGNNIEQKHCQNIVTPHNKW
jgi:hypothetical protein